MKVAETCSCGAKIEVDTADNAVALRVVEKWRRRHTHAEKYTRPVPYWPTVTWGSTHTGTTSATITRNNTLDEG